MKETQNTLPNWFNGEVYEEGGTVENPFSGEQWSLNAGELSMYDLIMGINYVGDHRGWDDICRAPAKIYTNERNTKHIT